MELHKAIKEIVVQKGAEMICNPQIINYLLDYQAFKEKPATKLILRAIIDSGYAENILALISDKNGWEIKFRQYQHEFIDSCGYKEELAAYVFDSIAYGLGLGATNVEPEIKPKFNVDSFFDIPEVGQKQQAASPQPQQKPSADPSDLYTIALSFFNEGKYQQAKGFMEKALSQYPQSNVPALYLKLMGDIHMKIGSYQEALQYYNECFVRKAAESKMSVDKLREDLKQHNIKGFDNSMFCYFFCLYSMSKISKDEWLKIVKSEAMYGLNDAMMYCVDNGINPMEKHIDIYFVDKTKLKDGDILYSDGSFAHEVSTDKKAIARVLLTNTSEYEKSQGWKLGYLIPVTKDGHAYASSDSQYMWSTKSEDLLFPHSHYTVDDINHWEELKTIESEQYISINDYDSFPIFKALRDFPVNIPISGTSQWFVPSIHWFKRTNYRLNLFCVHTWGEYWTSSQADRNSAIMVKFNTFKGSLSVYSSYSCANKREKKFLLPVCAF